MKKKIFLINFIILSLFTSFNVVKAEDYDKDGYIYSYWGDAIPSAYGMAPIHTYDPFSLGLAQFKSEEEGSVNPADVFTPSDITSFNDKLYVMDSKGNALIIINQNYQIETYITEFSEINSIDTIHTLNQPSGIAVTTDRIYIADTENDRILVLNHQYQVLDIYTEPADVTFEELKFKPLKIAVDKTGRIYVIVRDVFEGIIELNNDGSFNRYTGVNPISMNFVEVIWRKIYTEDQRKQMKLYLPTSFTNIVIDDLGFIYATAKADSSGSDEKMIKKINPKGLDVLKRTGYHFPKGDLNYVTVNNLGVEFGPSVLVDITINDIGMYTVLDQKRGRLFTYDDEGRLLYISADKGLQEGKLSSPVALTYFNNHIVVLDQKNKSLEVYGLTEFGELVNEAISLHFMGDFEEASVVWREVAKLNTNYEIAYVGIGKSLLSQGYYKEAMDNFYLGKDKDYYGKAFEGYRKELLNEYFSVIMTITTIGIIFLFRKPLIDIFKNDEEDED